MRVDIKTNVRVKDNDIRALYLICEAMKISSPHIRKANLEFGYRQWKNATK
jgi:hypothetical protein